MGLNKAVNKAIQNRRMNTSFQIFAQNKMVKIYLTLLYSVLLSTIFTAIPHAPPIRGRIEKYATFLVQPKHSNPKMA